MSDLSPVTAAARNDYSVARFSSADYAPSRRVEVLHEIFGRNLQKVHVEPLSMESFYTTVTLRRMPGLSLMTASRSAAIYRRSREFIEHDDVIVIAGITSSYEVHHLGRTIHLGPDEAVVLTGAEPASFGGPAQKSIKLLRVPVRLLSPRVANIEAAYGGTISADNPALSLLVRYIGLLDEPDGFATSMLRHHTVAHVHDLIALALGATRDATEVGNCRGARAARLRVIKDDIANNVGQADLSLAALAARHRINPRYLQRLFESESMTFTDYVLAERLAFAHRLLSDPRDGSKISAIAFDAGFGDLSYFNRTFRKHYGKSPSELRAAAKAAN
jgi:AraC-like DNA-binding protein